MLVNYEENSSFKQRTGAYETCCANYNATHVGQSGRIKEIQEHKKVHRL